MNREQKIQRLKDIASGRMAPVDLLKELPRETEVFTFNSRTGLYQGFGVYQGHLGLFTREELATYQSKYLGPVWRSIISRRGANGQVDDRCKNESTN